ILFRCEQFHQGMGEKSKSGKVRDIPKFKSLRLVLVSSDLPLFFPKTHRSERALASDDAARR
ncbi:MAG: hypothetical protein ABSH08_11580, partial [Tepidisphaeraceae bacterium]